MGGVAFGAAPRMAGRGPVVATAAGSVESLQMTTMIPELPLEAHGAEPFLLEIIELKWLLAGHGVRLHVERLQADRAYAQQVLALAAASSNGALRAAAVRLQIGLHLRCAADAPAARAGCAEPAEPADGAHRA